MGADKPKIPEPNYGDIWQNYSGWLRDEAQYSSGASSMARARMAASGLTPGSEAWEQRMAAETKGARDRMTGLKTGHSAGMLKENFASAFQGRKNGKTKFLDNQWKAAGGSIAGMRETLTADLKKLKARKPWAPDDPSEGGGGGAFQAKQYWGQQVSRVENQLRTLDIMEKGEAQLSELGFKDADWQPFELYYAGRYGVSSLGPRKKTAEEQGFEDARAAASGSGGNQRRGLAQAGANAGMTLGIEEDEDRSQVPWV